MQGLYAGITLFFIIVFSENYTLIIGKKSIYYSINDNSFANNAKPLSFVLMGTNKRNNQHGGVFPFWK